VAVAATLRIAIADIAICHKFQSRWSFLDSPTDNDLNSLILEFAAMHEALDVDCKRGVRNVRFIFNDFGTQVCLSIQEEIVVYSRIVVLVAVAQ